MATIRGTRGAPKRFELQQDDDGVVLVIVDKKGYIISRFLKVYNDGSVYRYHLAKLREQIGWPKLKEVAGVIMGEHDTREV